MPPLRCGRQAGRRALAVLPRWRRARSATSSLLVRVDHGADTMNKENSPFNNGFKAALAVAQDFAAHVEAARAPTPERDGACAALRTLTDALQTIARELDGTLAERDHLNQEPRT